jgi:adenylate kinase family enzyme
MENLSNMIILGDNSGSGKTTVANALQKKLGRGTLIMSQNVIGENDIKQWWNENDLKRHEKEFNERVAFA